jgi:hypothetical protein
MKAIQSDVQTLLEGSKQFVLPLYQRRYSWTKKHWTTLADDLDRLMREPERRSHFIGSFVTAPLEAAADQNVSRFRLIDGQQRLTTLIVLLAALRDVATEKGADDLALEIQGLYLTNQYKKGDAAKKLLLTEADRPDMDKIMVRPVSPAERIGEAYRFFRDRMGGLAVGELEVARQAALGRLAVVSITLEADDDPHMIFESLNAKGERLTQADLLRNYFLMRLPQGDADKEFARLWQPMQEDLGDDLTAFFRHFLMRDVEGAEVRRDEVYGHVKEQVDKAASTTFGVVAELEIIRRFASYYARLINPAKFEPDSGNVLRIRRLHHLKVTTAYPFLMNVVDAIAEARMAGQAFPATLDLIEAFLVRRLAHGIPTNQLRTIFRSLCRDAADATDAASFLTSVRRALSHKQRCPTDSIFRQALARRPLYGGSLRDAAKYILSRIEQSYAHKESPDTDAVTVQVEHILPQTLTDAWRAELSPDDPDAAVELQSHWLHTLGNLTLTGYNAEMSNAPFAQKRAWYAGSNFTLNLYFTGVTKWDADAIKLRGETLADLAISIWPDVAGDGDRAANSGTRVGRAKSVSPIAVIIGGKRMPVKNMLQAAQIVFSEMCATDFQAYSRSLDSAGSKIRRSKNGSDLRTGRLIGTEFVDFHGSNAALQKRCARLIAGMGLSVGTIEYVWPALSPN